MPTDALSSPYLAGTATWRPLLMGTRHMVAAGHHLAAQAAFEILEAGGNAFDAGAAAGIALGVVHTDIVNVAGVAPILVYIKERNEVLSVAGLGWWPRAITPDLFVRQTRGGWIVELNNAALPRVLVNRRYHAELTEAGVTHVLALGGKALRTLGKHERIRTWALNKLLRR